MTAIEKLSARIKKSKSALCVGLDPDPVKIPEDFRTLKKPIFEFNKFIVDQTFEFAAAYKPNSAFYEAQGLSGWEQLHETIDYVKTNHPEITVILDAKRADIGSTSAFYAKVAFNTLGADGVTVNPYLGSDALEPFLAWKDKIVVVLAKTSNPGSGEIQDLSVDGKPLWQHVIRLTEDKWNRNNNVMLVVGATYPSQLRQARQVAGEIPILVPGVGAQGGDLAAVMKVGNVLVNVSRDIIYSGNPGEKAQQYVQQMRQYAKIG